MLFELCVCVGGCYCFRVELGEYLVGVVVLVVEPVVVGACLELEEDEDGAAGFCVDACCCCCLSLDEAAATAAAAGEPAVIADTPPTAAAVAVDEPDWLLTLLPLDDDDDELLLATPVVVIVGGVDELRAPINDEFILEFLPRAAANAAADSDSLDMESFLGGKRSFTLSSVFASSNEIFFFSPSVSLPRTCLALFPV